jgi:aldose 1-epimerase
MRHRFRQPLETGPLVTLAHGGYELTVAPGFGGRLVSFRHQGRDLLRPTPAEVIARPINYGFAGFPLMPYSGPLFGPGFSFAGVDHVLDRTVCEEPSATHGDSWIAPFDILDQGRTALTLEMEHAPAPGTFPFRYRGHIRYALGDGGLSILLRVTSRDHRPMPAGLGIHPYFPKPPGTRLKFGAVAVWPPDAPEAVALGCGPLTPGLDFASGPDISGVVIDRLFDGWDGRATSCRSTAPGTIPTSASSRSATPTTASTAWPPACPATASACWIPAARSRERCGSTRPKVQRSR